MKATKLNLTAATIAEVVNTLKADQTVQKRWVKAADLLRAEGVTSDMLINDKEVRDAFRRDVILLSFSKIEQGYWLSPAASLSDEQKVTRRWVSHEMGPRLSRVTSYIKKAEDDEMMTDEEKGAQRVADLATRLKRDLTKWIDKVERAEAVTFSATQMVKFLKDASALIK